MRMMIVMMLIVIRMMTMMMMVMMMTMTIRKWSSDLDSYGCTSQHNCCFCLC